MLKMMKHIKILVEQSIIQASSGCDVLAPSDMMDGRIGKIRKALDINGFKHVQILSYAVKYASTIMDHLEMLWVKKFTERK